MPNRQPPRGYTPEEIDEGLAALALCSGNGAKAHALLAQTGLKVPRRTLNGWKLSREQRYREVQDRLEHAHLKRQAASFDEMVDLHGETEYKAANGLSQKLDNVDDLSVGELTNVVKNASLAKGVNFDKALLARGNPTTNPDHADYPTIMQTLRKWDLVVESTAEEEPLELEDGDARR